MAKHRELASIVSNKIWRTVVVAGAMLGTPVAVGCGGGSKPAPVTPAGGGDSAATPDKAADDKAAADKAAADKVAADAAAMAMEKEAADKAAADKAIADKEAADKEAADRAAKGKRPRGGGDKPTGRGFILS